MAATAAPILTTPKMPTPVRPFLLVEVDGERDEGSPVRRVVAAPREQERPQPRAPQDVAEHDHVHEQHAHRPTLAGLQNQFESMAYAKKMAAEKAKGDRD
jgi:hypothetical protein